MDAFNFMFSLFGLLLGLALAAVLSGFGNALQERHSIRIGWLTPLTGLVIALDLTSFWMLAWSMRSEIPVQYFSLLVGLIICGTYYLVARLVFPRNLEEWPDFDDYFFRHKRWLLGGMLLCDVAVAGVQAALGQPFVRGPVDAWNTATFYPLLAAAIFVRGKRLNLALLVLLVLEYPVFGLLYMLAG